MSTGMLTYTIVGGPHDGELVHFSSTYFNCKARELRKAIVGIREGRSVLWEVRYTFDHENLTCTYYPDPYLESRLHDYVVCDDID